MKLVVPGDRDETIRYCVNQFVALAKEAIEKRGAFYVALSGGSTPKAIFKALIHEKLDWKKVHLYWSDERSEPDQSNYAMAMEFFSKLPIEHIYRMVAEDHIAENAKAYERFLPDRFDLIMLGMGDDGHTASLFPETKALSEKERKVVANFIPQKQTWRMTFTFPLINSARNISIYVLGKEKAPTLKKVLHGGTFPINKVNGTIIADNEASS